MAITINDLLNDRSILDEWDSSHEECCYCGVKLQETITGKRRTPNGDACSDCYYEELGQGVEKDPITRGRIRRG